MFSARRTAFVLSAALWAAPAAFADDFDFTIVPATSSTNINFAVDAKLAGSLIGNYDATTNATGTRTKPGLSGTFGATENVTVPDVKIAPKTSGVINTKPDGLFRFTFDPAAGLADVSLFTANLLSSGPVTFPANADFTIPAFRTRTPSSTYFSATANVPLGDAKVTSAIATQVGIAAPGTLTPIGPDHYSFTVSPLVTLTAHVEFSSSAFDNTSSPLALPLTGEITITGDTATISASTNFNINQTDTPATVLDPFPFDLPTVLPPGLTAHVILSMTLNEFHIGITGPATLNASGVRPEWGYNGSGSWAIASNWIGFPPGDAGSLANFLKVPTSDSTGITLDGDRSVGRMNFDNPDSSYSLTAGTGGTLTFNNLGNNAKINVISGGHTINVPVSFVDNTDITVPALTLLGISGPSTIAPGKTLYKTEQGYLGLADVALGDLSILRVQAGLVDAGAIAGGGSIVVGTVNPASAAPIIPQPTSLAAKHIRARSLEIYQLGSVSINPNGGDDGTSVVDSLFIAGPTDAWSGQLDLADNDLIVHATPDTREAVLAKITNQIKSGRNSGPGLWLGQGIASKAAADDPTLLTGLAVMLNDDGSGTPLHATFSGQPVDANAVLVKYTWNGDTDLSGVIDADDYFRIDSGFAGGLTGYANGDFDYSETVDADDYFLIDAAFAGQSGVLGAQAVAVPEPAVLGLMGLGVVMMPRRRKTCRRGR